MAADTALPQPDTSRSAAASTDCSLISYRPRHAYRNNLDGHLAGVAAHAREAALANGAGASALARHLPGATAGAVVRAANDA